MAAAELLRRARPRHTGTRRRWSPDHPGDSHIGRVAVAGRRSVASNRLRRDHPGAPHGKRRPCLRRSALAKLAGLQSAAGDKADADRKRESLRVAAIEREYAAKLDDLRHNYALRVTVEWVQGLILFAPVHRYEVLIRRRKGERIVSIDWHPAARMMEPPLCEWGTGLERARLVCDERLHLTDLGGQAPCQSCGKAWCRACHGPICPRCKRATAASSEIKR